MCLLYFQVGTARMTLTSVNNVLTIFPGRYCTDDIDECSVNPYICHNGGTCNNIDGSYLCTCVLGWTGKNCEENVDDCVRNPCFFGATCHDMVGYYHCECPPGKTGEDFFSENIPEYNITD